MAFGVVYEDITAKVAGLVFGSTTTPTDTNVTAWITESTERISGVIRNKGIDPDSVTDALKPEGYRTIRYWVIADVARQAVRARDRNVGELYKSLKQDADELYAEIKAWPAVMGDAQPTADTSPNLTYQPRNTSGATWAAPGAAYVTNGRGQL